MWLCNCGLAVANASHCPLCRSDGQSIEPPSADYIYDDFDAIIHRIRQDLNSRSLKTFSYELDRLSKVETGETPMNPTEELHAKFFADEKKLIVDMSILELRAHREELAQIAFEARARLSAVDWEERERKAKHIKEKGATGFSRSVLPDDIGSDAINKINTKQKKLNADEKLKRLMMKSGVFDEKTAEHLMSAGTLLAKLRNTNEKVSPEELEKKPFFNPFAPKYDENDELIVEQHVEVMITEEATTIVVTEKEPEKKVEIYNPFKRS